MMDEIEQAWSETRINKPKNYKMPIWLTDEDFEYILKVLSKEGGELYERFVTIKEGSKKTQ